MIIHELIDFEGAHELLLNSIKIFGQTEIAKFCTICQLQISDSRFSYHL
jgi:hypothetical protein